MLWIPLLTNTLVFRGGIAWKPALFGWEFGKPSWSGEGAPFPPSPCRWQSLWCLRSSWVLSLKHSSLSASLSSPHYLSQGLLAHRVLHLNFNISFLGRVQGSLDPHHHHHPRTAHVLWSWRNGFQKERKIFFPTVKKKDELWAETLLHAWKVSKRQTYKQHLHNRHLAAFSDIFFNLFWHAIKE